ncbi:MAG: hypothetical protein ABIO24_01960 [Saprospiraceae bacterium]
MAGSLTAFSASGTDFRLDLPEVFAPFFTAAKFPFFAVFFTSPMVCPDLVALIQNKKWANIKQIAFKKQKSVDGIWINGL